MKNRVSITAEFAALIKAKDNPDYLYFVSPKTRYISTIVSFIFSKQFLDKIFRWRQQLTKEIDSIVERERPNLIVDLGSGYSLRGYTFCRKNLDLVYIDTDLPDVISNKLQILNKINRIKRVENPSNLHLTVLDVLNDDLQNIISISNSRAKILILAEGLTSYFSLNQLQIFFDNIYKVLKTFPEAVFYSNEKMKEPGGILYKFIRKMLSIFTHSTGHSFDDKYDFMKYISKWEGLVCEFEDCDSGHLIYKLKFQK
ncbi:MAG: hypothetical protein KGI50_05155 [Patescibacteria group bacterium]|nr:hypothetical protein [Patescibacteria group bacterium]MDE2438707.1 hypothetical protein [Patescibacteria group bacterium]